MSTEFPEKTFVLAKVKGYPEWPALVVPKDSIPENMMDKRPKTRVDSICVKFYFDDQYLWCSTANAKVIDRDYIRSYLVEAGEEVPPGEEDFVDNQAGRRKRVVSAYLKAYTLPLDEFIQWGSWGEPKAPEVDDLDELDDFDEEEEEEEEVKPKRGARSKHRAKAAAKPASKSTSRAASSRSRKRKTEDTPPTPAKRSRKKQPIADIPIIDNEEDEDFVEGEEDFEDEDGADSDVASDASDEEPIANIDADWGIMEQENPSGIDFSLVPESKILSKEVNVMTSWCWDIRYQIQDMLFPEEATKIKDERRKQLALDVKRMLKEEAQKQKLPPSASVDPEVKEEKEQEEKPQPQEEEPQIAPLNYRAVKKSLDALILQIVESDISKSVLRSTGLNKILLVVLKTPELQSTNTPKLREWWAKTYLYEPQPDNRWSPTFTNKMHEIEENAHREAEEERRRRRKEERRSTPTVTADP